MIIRFNLFVNSGLCIKKGRSGIKEVKERLIDKNALPVNINQDDMISLQEVIQLFYEVSRILKDHYVLEYFLPWKLLLRSFT